MANIEAANALKEELHSLLAELRNIQNTIRLKLASHANGKILKGNEIVGWLGEIYGTKLLGGTLEDDSQEHDLKTPEPKCWRVSVKARKGESTSWRRSSAIPKIDGEKGPTHLLFIKLDNHYGLEKAWLFDWNTLRATARFKERKVRGLHRSFQFTLNERLDKNNEIYPTNKFGL